jgi:hypothetical protein
MTSGDRLCHPIIASTENPTFIHHSATAVATVETFERGDEVFSKLSGGPIMTVLAVEGLKVRCSDDQERQYWFDTSLLDRYHSTQPCPDPVEQNSLPAIFPDLHSNVHCDLTSLSN